MRLGTYLRARPLSPAEVRYLLDAARGLTAFQSARKQHVSVNTVNSAMKLARYAIGADTTAHAVTLALAYGEILISEIHKDSAAITVPERGLSELETRSLVDVARGLNARQSAGKQGVPPGSIMWSLKTARTVYGAANTLGALTLAVACEDITIENIYPELTECRKGERP